MHPRTSAAGFVLQLFKIVLQFVHWFPCGVQESGAQLLAGVGVQLRLQTLFWPPGSWILRIACSLQLVYFIVQLYLAIPAKGTTIGKRNSSFFISRLFYHKSMAIKSVYFCCQPKIQLL
jgi:hypothetical protein